MTKKDFTEFECDGCKKKETILKGNGFPYGKGWQYIYNFEAKTWGCDSPVIPEGEIIGLKDRHYCSLKCLIFDVRKCLQDAEKKRKNFATGRKLYNDARKQVEKMCYSSKVF